MPKKNEKKEEEQTAEETEEIEEETSEAVEEEIPTEEEAEEPPEEVKRPKLETAPLPEFNLRNTAGDLRTLLEAIDILADEPCFDVSKDELKLRQMDASRVAMVIAERQASSFDEYEVSQEGKLCLSGKELLKILKRAGKDDDVILTRRGTGRLDVEIKGSYRRVFNMAILESSYMEEVAVPKVTLTTKLKLTSEGFQKAVEDANLVSDHVKIITDKEEIRLQASGDLMGANIDLKKGDDITLDVYTKEEAVATFSLSYLTEIVKAGGKVGDICTIEYAKDLPCKLSFGDQLSYWLAPRIEVD